jgi:pimeloyl-ACP methyl ester carboxylesterase
MEWRRGEHAGIYGVSGAGPSRRTPRTSSTIRSTDGRAYSGQVERLVDEIMTNDVIPRITIPTLIVGGGRSHIPLSSQRWLHRTIRGSRLEVLEDQAHLLFHEDPKNFNELVSRFMGATSGRRA